MSGVAYRTIQRVESDRVSPQVGTLAALAATFNTDVNRLLSSLELEDVLNLVDDCSCSVCGAPLVERTFVEPQYGDCEAERFACGATRGWEERPCPDDARIPEITDYEITVHPMSDGTFSAVARGLTEAARSVVLPHGMGATEEEARRQVRWAYVAAKRGYESADREVGPRGPGLP